jgi:hypothetical protein
MKSKQKSSAWKLDLNKSNHTGNICCEGCYKIGYNDTKKEIKKIIERKIDYYRQSKEDVISKEGINKLDINWYEGVFDILDELLKEVENAKNC